MSCGCTKGVTITLNALMIIKSLGYLFLGIFTVTLLPALWMVVLSGYYVSGLISAGIATSFNAPDSIILLSFVPYVMIGVGALVLFLGIWGIVAAATRNKCLLATAAVLLFVVLAVEVASAVFMGLGSAAGSANLTTDSFKNAYATSPGDATFTTLLGNYESRQECCGIEGPGDYAALTPSVDIPTTCCLKGEDGKIDVTKCKSKVSGYVNEDGCQRYRGQVTPADWLPLGILMGLAVITLFTIIFTICLSSMRGKEDYAY